MYFFLFIKSLTSLMYLKIYKNLPFFSLKTRLKWISPFHRSMRRCDYSIVVTTRTKHADSALYCTTQHNHAQQYITTGGASVPINFCSVLFYLTDQIDRFISIRVVDKFTLSNNAVKVPLTFRFTVTQNNTLLFCCAK